ncbi:MAG TPA: hypothetical protein VLT13_05570 [Bacteroidota bacterium]|nr:hypothetical protein [Bacteroidota bacterium]
MGLRGVWMVLLSLAVVAPAGANGKGSASPSKLHAAVYLVRGSVAGSSTGRFGPHVRESDSAWRCLSRSNVITYGFGSFTSETPRRFYVACGNGVHRSTDDGETWRILTGWTTMEILDILPHPTSPSLLYASTPWGVYRSRDAGAIWTPAVKGFTCSFVRHLAFDRRTPDVVYATAENDAYVTTNGGDEWKPMGVGHGAVLSFLQHPRMPDRLLAGCEDNGICLSTDGGKTWATSDCPSQASVYAIASSPDGKDLYAAGWETGIWHSGDGGQSWTVLWSPAGIQAFFCLLVDPADTRHLYAGTDGNGVYESVDGGRRWSYAGLNGGKIKHLFFYP